MGRRTSDKNRHLTKAQIAAPVTTFVTVTERHKTRYADSKTLNKTKICRQRALLPKRPTYVARHVAIVTDRTPRKSTGYSRTANPSPGGTALRGGLPPDGDWS
jgi:hypothetical protein